MADAVTIEDVFAARQRVAPFAGRTPLVESAALGKRAGHPVYLKKDHLLPTGSFKLRGATNAILSLSEEQRRRGVGAASTGNHGRALAHAASVAGARAVICMSSLVPANKVEAVKSLGAEARIVGRSQDDAQAEIDRLADIGGLIDIPPFDHAGVIAGQGTLGLEIIEAVPELEAVLVPLSGGGLISGVALAVKAQSPATRIIGISMERGAAMAASLDAGKPVLVEEVETLADSLGGGIGLDNRYTFAMTKALVDDVILLSEREIAEGIAYAYEREGEVLEGAGAVGIAALISGRFTPRGPTALVLSGKNIDSAVHGAIIARTHAAFRGGA